ncbi:MAG: hypothetical protein FWG61_08100 [Firmicutes bacterium]|nr:hypothetical protein [Bacillota bacterium]
MLSSTCEQQLALLPLIEKYAAREPEAYTALLPLANSADFSLRLRVLLALGRLKQGKAFLPLVEILKREKQNHWRLALLDTLNMLPYDNKLKPLLPLLARDQAGDGDAYFLSGLVWLLGQQGPEAILPLSELLLAETARARRLKDDLLAEAIFLAAGGNLDLVEQIAKQNPPLLRFCNNRIWPKTTRASFGIYPSPDYLMQQALQHGLSKQQYKKLHYWHKNKFTAAKRSPLINNQQ